MPTELQLNPKFEKNLTALFVKNPLIAAKLFELTQNTRYEIFQGKDPIDINMLDSQTHAFVYAHPLQQTELFIKNQSDDKIPYRYYFGMGNGVALNVLLSFPHIKRIVVIEPSIEILYITFHLLDFSEQIINNRLQIDLSENVDFVRANKYLSHDEGKVYAKFFHLYPTTPYYETVFSEQYKYLNKVMADAFYAVIAGHGNCAIDGLMGIEHHVKNLPLMVRNPKLASLEGKKNCNTAIVVSTGPSLSKQLPFLKKIQDHVMIICVDASFPILEKHGIKPDFVTVLERIPETGKFFQNNDPEFQDGVHFVLVSIVHEDIINAIRKGNKILEMRPHAYTKAFRLDDFGYLGSGMSAANLAHELAFFLHASNVILIGQDLAFGEDNSSHAEGHVYGENEENIDGHEIYVEKYGGNGTIRTTFYWVLFRNYFEKTIAYCKENNLAPTINCTEGGARIPGSIEMRFQQAIDQYIDFSHPKERITIELPTPEETEKYTAVFIDKINEWLKDTVDRQEKVEAVFLDIQKISEKLIELNQNNRLEEIRLEELLPYLDQIDSIKAFFSEPAFNELYLEIIQTLVFHLELDLVAIPMMNANTDIEKKTKVVDWIMQHRYWLFAVAGGIQAIRDTILRAIESWDPELKNRIIVPTKKEIVTDTANGSKIATEILKKEQAILDKK